MANNESSPVFADDDVREEQNTLIAYISKTKQMKPQQILHKLQEAKDNMP
jgi:hypothetical protein